MIRYDTASAPAADRARTIPASSWGGEWSVPPVSHPSTGHGLHRVLGNGALAALAPIPVLRMAQPSALSRDCDCGDSCGGGSCGGCPLTVSTRDDPAEREAERIADAVLRLPQQAAPDPAGLEVADEPARPVPEVARSAGPGAGSGGATRHGLATAIDSACRDGGHQLPTDARRFMEAGFQRDLGDVLVHTDTDAGQLAYQLQARAFTTGRHVFFAPGQFQPDRASGRRLLAHELTHVVQQGGARDRSGAYQGADRTSMIQRACGEVDIQNAVTGRLSAIELGDPGVSGTLVRFRVSCDEFLSDKDEAVLTGLARGLPPRTRIVIHGFASEEGPPMFNLLLSQARAEKVKDILSGLLDPAQIERVVMHGSVPGSRPDRRAVIIETKAALPPVEKRLDIVSWINGAGLPAFSSAGLALAPPTIRVLEATCMALKCTANSAPPAALPPSDVPAFLASKQYRAFQTYGLTQVPSTTGRGLFTWSQAAGYTAPSSCPDVPPSTFWLGETSPLNHATADMSGRDPKATALMKFRVSGTEESAAIAKATSFPGSILFSTRMLRHVPWVWTQASLRLDGKNGLLNWSVQSSAFPTTTIYLDGSRVAEIPQGPCGVVVSSRFRTADKPRQTMAEEAKQASMPISAQDETVDPGGSASGAG